MMNNLKIACSIISYIQKNPNSQEKTEDIINEINLNPSVVFKNLTIKKNTLDQPKPMAEELQQLSLNQNPIKIQPITSQNGCFNIATPGQFIPNQHHLEMQTMTMAQKNQKLQAAQNSRTFIADQAINQSMPMSHKHPYNQSQSQNHLKSNNEPGLMNGGFHAQPSQSFIKYQVSNYLPKQPKQPMEYFQQPFQQNVYTMPNHLKSNNEPGLMNGGFNPFQNSQSFIQYQVSNYLPKQPMGYSQQQPMGMFANQLGSYQNPMATTIQPNSSDIKPLNLTTPFKIGSSQSAFKLVKGNSSKISENINQTATNIANYYMNQYGNQPKSN